jgi:DNA-binding IclR family transcriptional regulator
MPSATLQSSRKTLDKAMQLLTEFSVDRPELAISELAEQLGMHKSVVSRLASSLLDWGMLERNPRTRRFRVGPTAFRIGTLFSQRRSLVVHAMPALAKLAQTTGHSVHLSVLDGLRILVVASVESASAVRVIMRVGDHRPLHSTAAGKLFLALSGPELFDAACPDMAALTQRTITDPAAMRRAIETILRTRVAFNEGENSPHAGAVAAPVIGHSGEIEAAVSTVYPLYTVDHADRAQIAGQTMRCAEELTLQARQPARGR